MWIWGFKKGKSNNIQTHFGCDVGIALQDENITIMFAAMSWLLY